MTPRDNKLRRHVVQASVFLAIGLMTSYLAAITLGIGATVGGLTSRPIRSAVFQSEAGPTQLVTSQAIGFTELNLSEARFARQYPSHSEDYYLGLWEQLQTPAELVPLPWWADDEDRMGTVENIRYRAVGFPLRMLIRKSPPHELTIFSQARGSSDSHVVVVAPDAEGYPDSIRAHVDHAPDPLQVSPVPSLVGFDGWRVLRVRRGTRTWDAFGAVYTYYSHEEIPLVPRLLPWLANGAILGLLLWLVFFAPFRLRLALRRRAGKCVKCKYDLTGLGTGEPCPECGRIEATGLFAPAPTA